MIGQLAVMLAGEQRPSNRQSMPACLPKLPATLFVICALMLPQMEVSYPLLAQNVDQRSPTAVLLVVAMAVSAAN
jgi:hypothetical protein